MSATRQIAMAGLCKLVERLGWIGVRSLLNLRCLPYAVRLRLSTDSAAARDGLSRSPYLNLSLRSRPAR